MAGQIKGDAGSAPFGCDGQPSADDLDASTHVGQTIAAGASRASDDPYTIQAIGGLTLRLHAAEALQEKAGLAVDAAVAAPSAETVAKAPISRWRRSRSRSV